MKPISLLELALHQVQEAKQVGLLYHYTTPKAFELIKACNCLKAGTTVSSDTVYSKTSRSKNTKLIDSAESISVTRNKNLHKTKEFSNLELSRSGPSVTTLLGDDNYDIPSIRLTLDGDKLSERYRIEPFRFYYAPSYITKAGPKNDEYEEKIITKEIKDLSQYIVAIDDVKNEIPHFRDWEKDDWDEYDE